MPQDTQQNSELIQTENLSFPSLSHLDFLKNLYNSEHSYFSTIAKWYGDYSYWKKIFLAISVTGAFFLLSTALSALGLINLGMVILITISSLLIYIGVTILLSNYHANEVIRFKKLSENIEALELSAKIYTQAIEERSKQFAKLLEEQSTLNSTLTDSNEKLKGERSKLEAENRNLKLVIQEIKSSSQVIYDETQKLSDTGEKLCQQLTSVGQSVEKNKEIIDVTNNNLENLNPMLVNHIETIKTLENSVDKSNLLVKEVSDKLKQASEKLDSDSNNTSHILTDIRNKRKTLKERFQVVNARADEIIARHQSAAVNAENEEQQLYKLANR